MRKWKLQAAKSAFILLLVCNVHDGVPGVHQVKVAVWEGGLGRVQLAEGHAGLDLKKDEKNDDLKKIS